jgi:CRISPR-associated protein (TIGR02710 family)
MPDQIVQRVLIQTVGTGGPANPVWEALAFTVRTCRPTLLVQWCSRETLVGTVPRFEQCLAPADRPPEIRRAACDNPDDVDELARAYVAHIDELRREFPDALIELDFTSGTKPMSAAAVAAAVARRLPRLHYAVGPRDDTGRVTETSGLVSLETGHMVADGLLQELGRLFDRGQFTAVSEQARQLVGQLADRLLLARAASLAWLAEVYELWDRFAWAAAFSKLRDHSHTTKAPHGLKDAGWDLGSIATQTEHLQRCKNAEPGPERLADLFANAQRRIGQGKFDDAVARLYRLIEYVGQVRFRTIFGITRAQNPTSKVPIGKLQSLAPQLATEIRSRKPLDEPDSQDAEETPPASPDDQQPKPPDEGFVDLGLQDTFYALAEAGDPIGRPVKARFDGPSGKARGPLANLLHVRNNSLLAHGDSAVSKDAAEALFGEANQILTEHFRAEGLDLPALIAPATFLRCPWTR